MYISVAMLFIKGECEMLSKEIQIMNLENRIALLSNRDPVGNTRIINKAKRRLRRMRESV